jgi:DNA-binding beta-propeller fold protein YncE
MRNPRSHFRAAPHGALLLAATMLFAPGPAGAAYLNFESSQVHPIALTPSGARLLVVNTPDAILEVFAVAPDGGLRPQASIPVGLEPISVAARSDSEAWVVDRLSDSVSVVDLDLGVTVRTLPVGDEPTDVVFAAGKAYVAVSHEDAVKVFDPANPGTAPARVDVFGRFPRALAAARDGSKVYAVAQNSGNQTTVVNANIIASNSSNLDATRLGALGLNNTTCATPPPAYPPLPSGVFRNPALTDPPPPQQPPVGLIVKWDGAAGKWRDEAGQDWSACLPFRLPDHDLFVIDTATLAVTAVDHLGTTLFEVSVNPANGRIYVPHTEARNFVRFELPQGVGGHPVDDRLAVVDPANGNAVTIIDLNTHIDRASDPSTNILEREASLSQPGMMVWDAAGAHGYLTAIGSRKLFRVDGKCLSGSCIFGADRALPDAVVVGDGPTGVALNEGAQRLYVLNRFDNTLAIVDAGSLTKIETIPLHDPSSLTIRAGRKFLYDAILTSGHGDAACSSCHVSGDRDGLAWDLGNPEGNFTPYGTTGDNVRFIIPLGNQPTPCDPALCAAHAGFDPQKGPMTTQTLRGMLEPLHWRGDRPTMDAFNKAFVSLMGTADIGPINGEPAGLSASDMEAYRQFALGIAFPPNPLRGVDDSVPDATVSVPGVPYPGNPASGQTLFTTGHTDANQPCSACHALPFGTAGGKIGGINPGDPSTAPAALFNGNADGSPHSDLKVPHLRNMYEKFGPRFGSLTNSADPPADQKSGFGFIHDGSVPDLGTFLSANVFTLTAQQVKDLTMFVLFFPTGTRPSVGRALSVPPGVPPTGTPAQETLLTTLLGLGNLADVGRHCELVASAESGGRLRTWFLNGGLSSGGLWTTDVAAEAQVSTSALRQSATSPVSFLCATLGSGVRLGADRDEDGHFNGDDCAPADPGSFAAAQETTDLAVAAGAPTALQWDAQAATAGPGIVYDVAGGEVGALRSAGTAAATSCLASGLAAPSFSDDRPDPAPGKAWFYLSRARNACATSTFGAGGGADALSCGP